MAERSRLRSGCSRRCSIASPTTSRTRSRSRARRACCRRRRLRQAVLRDLAWLFNATRLEAVADLAKRAVRAPVGVQLRPAGAVGQGRPPRSTSPTSTARSARRSSIFEPRILPATLRDQDAARGRCSSIITTSSASRFTASSGRSRCRWSSWSAPSSISKPGRCRSPISSPPRVA